MAIEVNTLVGLVDADLLNGGTRHPNLVLLKIAGFLKDNDVPFRLVIDPSEDMSCYSHVFMSRVFSASIIPPAIEEDALLHPGKYSTGGTGYYVDEINVPVFRAKREEDMGRLETDPFLNKLKNKRGGPLKKGIDMQRQMPYYHLYDEYVKYKIASGRDKRYFDDYLYYSIGFLTRGCVRHCPFCVNKLEKQVYRYSKLEWFLDEERDSDEKLIRPYIYLWDDNFLAAPKEIWKPALQELIDSGRPFQFRQGLDERMLAESPDGEEIAQMLSKCRYHGDFIFAFDNWKDRPKIEKALSIWKKYCPKKSTKFYLFCGYQLQKGDDEKLYQDIVELFSRIKVLMQYGCFGYIMRHADYLNHDLSNIYVQIARWCNQPQFYRYMSFWEYCYRNQSFWEQTTKKLNVPNQISFKEFEKRYKSGYYELNGLRLCKTMRTFMAFLDRFSEHRKEILKMFRLKLKDTIRPSLWE